MSFLKQLPPKPTELFRNLSPILVSAAMHFLTYLMSESYSSHNMAILLIEETLWARKQLAANLESQAEALLVKIILYLPAYSNRFESFEMSLPYLLPMMTRSGFIKSATAVPYAKNYGLLAIVNFLQFGCMEVALMIPVIILKVPIGTVDFSTRMTLSSIGCQLQ